MLINVARNQQPCDMKDNRITCIDKVMQIALWQPEGPLESSGEPDPRTQILYWMETDPGREQCLSKSNNKLFKKKSQFLCFESILLSF